jgi:hypothetical protein
MRMEFFGDSYDAVKRFMLHSVAPEVEWSAFPMFTHKVSRENIAAYEFFIGVRIVRSAMVTVATNRTQHLLATSTHRHIFIDPDTGIKLKPSKGARSIRYIFGPELATLCREDDQRLIVIFDQSYSRCASQTPLIKEKLSYFKKAGIHGFAYDSHARFLILSGNKAVCDKAKTNLLASGLPKSRSVGA